MIHDKQTEPAAPDFHPAPTQARNSLIDLLRFIFIIPIVIGHQTVACGGLFPRSVMAVYFFFILSGYLAAVSIKKQTTPGLSYSRGFSVFMKRKILAVHPEVILTTLIFLILLMSWASSSPRAVASLPVKAFFSDILFLRMTGIESSIGVEYGWYISSMLIGLAILYPFIRKWGSSLFFLLASILIFGYVKIETGQLFPLYSTPLGFTYAGNYMALGGLTLGIGIAAFREQHKAPSKYANILAMGFLLVSLYCMSTPFSPTDKPHTMDTLCLFSIAMLVLCTTGCRQEEVAQGSLRRKWQSLCIFLGKLTLPLYLVHITSPYICFSLFPSTPGPGFTLIYLAVSIVSAFLVMLAANFLRKKIAHFYQ